MSKRYSFNKEDGKKILKGASIALAGALLTYLSEVVMQVDFAEYTPLVMGVWSVLVNAAQRFIKQYSR